MRSYVMGVRNDLHKISLFLQILNDRLPGLVTLHACILAALLIDNGVIGHNIDLRQVVALPYLEVIGIVRRSDLNRTGPEFLIYIIICHDRDLSVHQREYSLLPYDILVSVIVRMYCDRRIAQHGLRTSGRNLKELIRSCDRILDMPEEAVLLLMLNLCI